MGYVFFVPREGDVRLVNLRDSDSFFFSGARIDMTNEMTDDLKIWLFVSHDFPQDAFLWSFTVGLIDNHLKI